MLTRSNGKVLFVLAVLVAYLSYEASQDSTNPSKAEDYGKVCVVAKWVAALTGLWLIFGGDSYC